MEFRELLDRFSAGVERGDGRAFAALFTEDGVYHDHFYGDFAGRDAIARLIEAHFHKEGEAFHWRFRDGVSDGRTGYASFRYAYTARSKHAAGRRVALEGMSRFRLREGLIADYNDAFEGGVMLHQLGTPPEVMARIFAKWSAHQLEDPAVAALMRGAEA